MQSTVHRIRDRGHEVVCGSPGDRADSLDSPTSTVYQRIVDNKATAGSIRTIRPALDLRMAGGWREAASRSTAGRHGKGYSAGPQAAQAALVARRHS